jgi:hypothetical protein
MTHTMKRISAALATLALTAAGLLGSAAGAQAQCANEALRLAQQGVNGLSAGLPDCRAYELVTPARKDGGEPLAVEVGFAEAEMKAIPGARASEGEHAGDAFAWASEYALPGSRSAGLDYLSTRSQSGWATRNTIPPQTVEYGIGCPLGTGMVGWSSGLEKGVLEDGPWQESSSEAGGFHEDGRECGHDEPRLIEGEPEGFQNLFVSAGGASPSFRLVNVTPRSVPRPRATGNSQLYYAPTFLAASGDLRHVVFEDELPLVQGAPGWPNEWEGHDNLYEYSEGPSPSEDGVRLLSILPNGEAARGRLAGSTENGGNTGAGEELPQEQAINLAAYTHAVSSDGSRIFFQARTPQQEAQWQHAKEVRRRVEKTPTPSKEQRAIEKHETLEQAEKEEKEEQARLKAEKEQAEREEEALGPQSLYVRENGDAKTEGACGEAGKACTVALDAPQQGAGPGGAGSFLAANAAGTKAFFTDESSRGLTADTAPGSGRNLYEYDLEHNKLTDLTPASLAGVLGLSGVNEGTQAQEAGEGSYVYFVATGALTTQPNSQNAHAQAGRPNLYLRHAGATTFIATLAGEDSCDWASNEGCLGQTLAGLTARVSANGRFIAFPSVNALTSSTTGSVQEIYLYDAAANTLSCASCFHYPSGEAPTAPAIFRWPTQPDENKESRAARPQHNVSDTGQVFFESADRKLEAVQPGGARNVYEYESASLHLISSGAGNVDSYFLDATPDGSNVFFATAQQLLRGDTDQSYDIYDARTGGGFPEPAATVPCESEESCRGASALPSFPTPLSATFSGPGDLAPAAPVLAAAPAPKARARLLARAERLARALEACRRMRARKRRAACMRRAERLYGRRSRGRRRHAGGARARRASYEGDVSSGARRTSGPGAYALAPTASVSSTAPGGAATTATVPVGEPEASAVPQASVEEVKESELTMEDAALHGTVEGGIVKSGVGIGFASAVGPLVVHECEFEYGHTLPAISQVTGEPEGAPEHVAPCVPAPPYTKEPVSAELEGLARGSVYDFRLRAVEELEGNKVAGYSSEKSFQTLAPGPPRIDHEYSTETTATDGSIDVSLNANIRPFDHPTTCEVQYLAAGASQTPDWTKAATAPCPAQIGSEQENGLAFGDKQAVVKVQGLSPGTLYDYRFVAKNSAPGGETDGPDKLFFTFGIETFALRLVGEHGEAFTQAGGHPYELIDEFKLSSQEEDPWGKTYSSFAVANPKDIDTSLPSGLIGNPSATPRCEPYQIAHADCTGAAQVGLLEVETNRAHTGEGSGPFVLPLYNIVPPAGLAAQLAVRANGYVTAHIDAKLRSGGDYGVDADSLQVSAVEGIIRVKALVWGVPHAPVHDTERYCPKPDAINELPATGGGQCPSDAQLEPDLPFLTAPTACSGALSASMSADSWQAPGSFTQAKTEVKGAEGCEHLEFTPSVTLAPSSTSADSPSGLDVSLHIPRAGDLSGPAQSALKDTTVALPAGIAVNPAAASGLSACSEQQAGVERVEPDGTVVFREESQAEQDGQAPRLRCPEGSKIGTVEVQTGPCAHPPTPTEPCEHALIDHPLKGAVFIAQQGNAGPAQGTNPFGSLLALYLAIEDPASGIVVKLAGEVKVDPATGQLTSTFKDAPQLPFEDFKLHLFAGPRASLAMPDRCGPLTASGTLAPWSGTSAVSFSSPLEVSTAPGGGSCSSLGSFSPSFSAGTSGNGAGAFSPFELTISRSDGEQRLSSVKTVMPPGLAGVIAGVSLCGEAQANAGDCPASSKIGHVTVLAGVGPDPVTVPGPGGGQDPVYLTGPFDGAPFGLSIVVPAQAGPFDLDEGGHPVVVRAKIEVDPHTAQIAVASAPMPSTLQGIPVDVKAVNVSIDRPGFIFDPTSCNPMQITGTISSTQGSARDVSSRFQAAGCAALAFHPGFAAATSAHYDRRNGDSLHVTVTSGPGQANIAKVHTELPVQLPARLSTLKLACAQAQFESNPAACPSGAFVGEAIAHTPVLPAPLSGPAILVSHGGAAFPDLDIVLQGEGITFELRGETFIDRRGVTSSTFASVPDVPVSSFTLDLPAGPHSALTGAGNLCGQTVTVRRRIAVRHHGRIVRVIRTSKETRPLALTMPTTITGQNGRVVTQATAIAVSGCAHAPRPARGPAARKTRARHRRMRSRKHRRRREATH